ncbi:MAG: hypothetical protein M3Y88_06380 [Chloroflexota bacterium]|nr:hypothetical protein [Chloroflexota bacterium]
MTSGPSRSFIPSRDLRAAAERRGFRRPAADERPQLTVADLAECGCPEWCHRDHENE